MDTLLSLIESLGYALDTPGAYTRGLLSGRPGERASGRDMLRSWGIEDPGFWGGTAAEMLADPLNMIPAGIIANTARKSARSLRPVKEMLDSGHLAIEGIQDAGRLKRVLGRVHEMDPSLTQHPMRFAAKTRKPEGTSSWALASFRPSDQTVYLYDGKMPTVSPRPDIHAEKLGRTGGMLRAPYGKHHDGVIPHELKHLGQFHEGMIPEHGAGMLPEEVIDSLEWHANRVTDRFYDWQKSAYPGWQDPLPQLMAALNYNASMLPFRGDY